jgi:hypothetical protein
VISGFVLLHCQQDLPFWCGKRQNVQDLQVILLVTLLRIYMLHIVYMFVLKFCLHCCAIILSF